MTCSASRVPPPTVPFRSPVPRLPGRAPDQHHRLGNAPDTAGEHPGAERDTTLQQALTATTAHLTAPNLLFQVEVVS